MKLKFIIIIIIIFSLFLSALLYYSFSQQSNNQLSSLSTLHFYDEPSIDLKHINLYAIYVVAADKKNEIKNNWQQLIEKSLQKISAFHQNQFRNLSHLEYKIYKQPIIIENIDTMNNKGFDVTSLPEFFKIIEKIDKEMPLDFITNKNDIYKILVIFYEGENTAFGSAIVDKENIAEKYQQSSRIITTTIENFNGVALISNDYLNKPYGESILYHEIAHTLGIPDFYKDNQELSLDIMGNGRFIPLEINYLDYEIIKKMTQTK
ncbi:MAG: hypothetical protein KatS3mg097_135 [Candidatus Parcubacteria bacterium]|nr:MAG: hypothetical protein KatS3mg097_135 [Candidatus Parcubacteria bacterium]